MKIATIIILILISGCANYIAYTHVRRYKYYKQVVGLSLEQSLFGIIIGFPYIFLPFAITESDKGFMKYAKVKNALFWARISTSALSVLIIIYILLFFYTRWTR